MMNVNNGMGNGMVRNVNNGMNNGMMRNVNNGMGNGMMMNVNNGMGNGMMMNVQNVHGGPRLHRVRGTSKMAKSSSNGKKHISKQSVPTILTRSSLAEWFSAPTAPLHKGLVVRRDRIEFADRGRRFHALADQLEQSLAPPDGLWEDIVAEISVHVDDLKANEIEKAESLFRKNASALVSTLATFDHPEAAELAAFINSDACALAGAMFQLHEGLHEIVMRIELIKKNTCARWHQDNHTGRAIVTYNGPGTVFQDDSNVHWGKLRAPGSRNPGAVINPARTQEVRAGDMLFMRGSKANTGGLVHKAPPFEFLPNGRVLPRIVLKVDIPA